MSQVVAERRRKERGMSPGKAAATAPQGQPHSRGLHGAAQEALCSSRYCGLLEEHLLVAGVTLALHLPISWDGPPDLAHRAPGELRPYHALWCLLHPEDTARLHQTRTSLQSVALPCPPAICSCVGSPTPTQGAWGTP